MLLGDQRQNSFSGFKQIFHLLIIRAPIVGTDQSGKAVCKLPSMAEVTRRGGRGPHAKRDGSCHSGQRP